jgi:hypothetical protein
MSDRDFPPALPHGALTPVFDDVYFVTGTIALPGPLPVRFSRNMVVVREGTRLVLVHSLRLDEAGLAALDALGEVTDVIRLAGFHGRDDRFYQDRYGAKVWALAGAPYVAGFGAAKPGAEPYFRPDVEIGPDTELPLSDASLYVFPTTPAEGMLLLERDGGILVSGDCLQHWHEPDAYFSFVAKLMMRVMGFIKPHNVGPGWLRSAKPAASDIRGLLDLPFEHVLPVHGAPVLGDAKTKFRAAIDRVAPP